MIEYSGNFEIHLTVADYGKDIVEALSRRLSCKFVHIQLARGTHASQPMVTWQRSDTNLSWVTEEANARANLISDLGIHVFRIKIEVDPNNADVPVDDSDATRHSPGHYFEHHIKVQRPASADLKSLAALCEQHGAHLSRNARRKSTDGMEERFVTMRDYGVGRVTSGENLQRLIEALRASGENIIETESEYTVYDSAIQLDAGWLPSDKTIEQSEG